MKLRFALGGIVLGFIVVMCLACSVPGSAGANPDDIDAVARGNNAFAFDLYGAIAQKPGNLFFSPFSISSALAMTYAGARGETARQMEKTLHFDSAAEKLNPGFSELMKAFNAPGKDYLLSVANALWGQKGTYFQPEFLEITRKYYDAGFRETDYIHDAEGARQEINHWTLTKTNRKIVDLIKPGILTDLTRLVLTNAIYFKGRWKLQFKPERTQEAPFHASAEEKPNVPLMYQLGEFKYAETGDFQILELPYNGGDMVMDVLLPKPHSGLAELEAGLQSVNFESWLDRLSTKKVAVFLPRFKLDEDLSLAGCLQSLGMKDAFDENAADFSGMSTTFLYISHVIHKAFIEVNEEGTEAAAATAVVMTTKGAPSSEPPVFRADRPFFFLIRDTQTGSIMFMGRFAIPRQ